MKEVINTKTYNTETSTLVKYIVDEESLGDGYTLYKVRALYYKPRVKEYFLAVTKICTDRRNNIFDLQEYIVPVTREWASSFNRDTEDIYPE